MNARLPVILSLFFLGFFLRNRSFSVGKQSDEYVENTDKYDGKENEGYEIDRPAVVQIKDRQIIHRWTNEIHKIRSAKHAAKRAVNPHHQQRDTA